MSEACIPVDLLNPGQVFACLGFLETAEVLLGDAEGGFDWSDAAKVHFRLCAKGTENPFAVVLQSLADARLRRIAPAQRDPKQPKTTESATPSPGEGGGSDGELERSASFPGAVIDAKTFPVRLACGSKDIHISHWCDGSSRSDFKLFAGQQRGPAIARALLDRVSIRDTAKLSAAPFDELLSLDKVFYFDARGAWTGLDAGYSPDTQGHEVKASPVVEMLAAIGLEHARPDEYESRRVRYAAWYGLVPTQLARPALAGSRTGVPVRAFSFELMLKGKNKIVTFAQEEAGRGD